MPDEVTDLIDLNETETRRVLREDRPPWIAVVAAVVVGIAVFILDVSLPLGVAGGVPYVALVLIAWWFPKKRMVFIFAIASSALTALGYFLSPDGGIPWVVFTNRAYALFAIWVTAIILFAAMRTRELLLRNEARLTLAKHQAESATLAKSRFLSSMSHELRTPMNAVIGFAQLMQHNPKEPLSDDQQIYTTNIIDAGEMLLDLINGVLDMAKIEAGQLNLSIENASIDTLIKESLMLAQPLADAHNIKISAPDQVLSHLVVRADPLRLKQVLLNFLSNAVKYNKPSGHVNIVCEERDDGFLRISVNDTGMGIPAELQSQLFRPFERLGVEAKKTIEGTGIGLTVAKQLMDVMNGRIGFDSVEDEGSSFWVDVPMAPKLMTLSWSDKLKVGIAHVDDDHQVLIDLLNKLSAPALEDDEVEAVIAQLLDYTLYHFRREEAVMEACDYPHMESHKKLHRDLTDEAGALIEKWHAEKSSRAIEELTDFMRSWLVTHIMQIDTQITEYAEGKEEQVAKALEGLGKGARP